MIRPAETRGDLECCVSICNAVRPEDPVGTVAPGDGELRDEHLRGAHEVCVAGARS